MAEFPPPEESAAARAAFANRVPSIAWEQIPLGSGTRFFWIWFKPAVAPQGFLIRIPPETYRASLSGGGNSGERLTLRTLLGAAGIDPQMISLS